MDKAQVDTTTRETGDFIDHSTSVNGSAISNDGSRQVMLYCSVQFPYSANYSS